MKTNRIYQMTTAAILLLIAVLAPVLTAGNLNPPAPPTTGTMKPLSDIEPRTAIHLSDVPRTISQTGSYYLAENLSYAGDVCIYVTAEDVTIDLNGFTIDGGGACVEGIQIASVKNVEIRNGRDLRIRHLRRRGHPRL